MADIRIMRFNPLEENTYIVSGKDGECVVIDPGCSNGAEFSALSSYLRKERLRPGAILLTHGHFDHMAGIPFLLGEYCPDVYWNPVDSCLDGFNRSYSVLFDIDFNVDTSSFKDITKGNSLSFGELLFEVIPSPGHTPGSVCLLEKTEGVLFTGDTLMAGTIGRTDLPFGDYDKEIVSVMDTLMGLDPDIAILPGHGADSTIGRERTHNPFLEPFNEREELDL